MPEKVSIRKGLNLIQIDSFDVVTEFEMRASLETVMQLRREHGITRVFVDASKQISMPSTVPIFQFGSELASTVRDMKFAVYFSPDVGHGMSFLEDVAVNRGVQVKRFETADAALEWLLE